MRLFPFGALWIGGRVETSRQSLIALQSLRSNLNEVLEPFHNRSPHIIERKDHDRWLAPSDPVQLPVDLLRTPDAETMKAWRVSPLKGNGPRLLHPPQVQTDGLD
ncbi:SOS response-associated peptidase family protein [Terracidiphilus gabretensis]|uniref:SOS response-associated peptidase family protein n=1 Tax=Terracidiphilus gabretensis TaxID=1577687 RepID=UPI0038B6114A